jgi:hypothetical protein
METVDGETLSPEDFQLLKYPLEYINVQVTNFYADIDIHAETMIESDFKELREKANEGFAALDGYVYTDGSYWTEVGKKISFHLHSSLFQIYKQSFTWKSEYGALLKNTIFAHMSTAVREQLEKGMDDSVYGNKRYFRTPYSLITGMSDPSKNKLHPHRPMIEASIQSYLVTSLPDLRTIHPLMVKMSQRRVDEESYKCLSHAMSLCDEEGVSVPRTKMDKEKIMALLDCLDPEKRAYSQPDWLKLAFLIKAVLGPEGVDKFVEISRESGYEKFDERKCRTEYQAIQDKNNKMSIGSLIFFAREDDPEEAESILAKKNVKDAPKGSIVVYNDKEAGIAFHKQVRDVVIRSNGMRYVKVDNRWISDINKTSAQNQQDTLMKKCHYSNIYYVVNSIYLPKYASLSGAKTIVEEMWLNVPDDPTFESKLSLSTVNKLCFRNGVYDFVKKEFMTWNNLKEEVYTENYINDTLGPAVKEEIEAVRAVLASCVGEDRIDDVLRYYARSIAGCYTDKGWAVMTGFRDSGKGVIVDLFTSAFDCYVDTVNAENFFVERVGNGDSAKKLSWTVSIKDKRIVFTNEITLKEDEKIKPKIDGNIMKKLSSGGDRVSARTNYKDERTFYFMPKVTIMCNDLPEVSPKDAEETRTFFRCPHKYYPKHKLEEMQREGANMMYARLADDTLKSRIRMGVYANGLRHLLIQSYLSEKYIPSSFIKEENDMFNDDECDEFGLVQKTFVYTGKKDDVILMSMMKDFITENNLNMTIKKVKLHLQNIGGQHSKTIYYQGHVNVTGIVGIRKRE